MGTGKSPAAENAPVSFTAVRKARSRQAKARKKEKKALEKKARQAKKRQNAEPPKSKEEKKALKKARKEANAPALQEKRRQRLLKQSKRLEMQGNKLLAEAKKLAEQYKMLTEAKKLEDAKKENPYDIDVSGGKDGDSPSTTSSSSDSASEDGGAQINPGSGFFIDTKKRSRESDVAVADKEVSKPKKVKTAAVEESSDSDDTSSSESGSESESEVDQEAEKKIEKTNIKDKSNGRAKKGKSTEDDTAGNPLEQWNVGGLEGGVSRQSKFARLLGVKKGSDSAVNTNKNAKSDSIKAEADIQRQFEAGMKAKADGTGKRRGLGA
ncbi:hypothetical protein QQS21_004539 [Conoideocrella luteorostrata]|uniref:Small acidic protein-like domain-containing protein n=1 Tax=Conoideocrella luteorostrata TaxID=1105319 RepID=A0AAJ0FUM2_9HYPO|nr:hypothetical protein QQS21_004539 [Conoideocrella luteorostrata]